MKEKKIRCPYCGSEKIYYNDYVGVYHCRNCKGDTLEPIKESDVTKL